MNSVLGETVYLTYLHWETVQTHGEREFNIMLLCNSITIMNRHFELQIFEYRFKVGFANAGTKQSIPTSLS